MWEETRKVQDKARTITRIVRMDTDGNTIAGPYTLYVKLSGCQPFVSADDHLVWYTTAANNSATYFYRLDLQNLSSYDNIDPDQTSVKKVLKASGYELQYSLKKSFSGKHTKRLYGVKGKLSLKKKKTYYIRARAVRSGSYVNGSNTVKGSWRKVKKIRTK